MKQFLPEFAPLTYSWGFIEHSLGSLADFFLDWTRSHVLDVKGLSLASRIELLLTHLAPLTLPPTKDLLVETRSSWTALFDNGARGSGVASPISYAARQLGCRAVAVTCVPNTLTETFGKAIGTYGAVQFELFSPVNTGFLNYERSVGAVNDGGKWVFSAAGREQPFEETGAYTKRRVSDRFTPEMLERYAHALGIELFEPAFYGPNGYLIEKYGVTTVAKMTLEEA
jgi:hypothetical protein